MFLHDIWLAWLTSRRFFNELAMAGLANPVDQWVGAKCDNVILNFAPSDKNIKVISFSVFQIFHSIQKPTQKASVF